MVTCATQYFLAAVVVVVVVQAVVLCVFLVAVSWTMRVYWYQMGIVVLEMVVVEAAEAYGLMVKQ
jgi:hypothetical protein